MTTILDIDLAEGTTRCAALVALSNPLGTIPICGHLDSDDMSYSGSQSPYYPWGSLDGKVTTQKQAAELAFEARWGRACGLPLDAGAFMDRHPQYDWLRGHMLDRPPRPWIYAGGPLR